MSEPVQEYLNEWADTWLKAYDTLIEKGVSGRFKYLDEKDSPDGLTLPFLGAVTAATQHAMVPLDRYPGFVKASDYRATGETVSPSGSPSREDTPPPSGLTRVSVTGTRDRMITAREALEKDWGLSWNRDSYAWEGEVTDGIAFKNFCDKAHLVVHTE